MRKANCADSKQDSRSTVNLEGIISLYGAVLATLLAVAHLVAGWSRRVKLGVKAGIERQPLDASARESSRGSPLRVSRDGHDFWEEVLVGVEVRNKRGTPVGGASMENRKTLFGQLSELLRRR